MRLPPGVRAQGPRVGLSTAVVLALVLLPSAARPEDVVVFRDGQVARVQRAEELPDRVRIRTMTGAASELPRDMPAATVGPQTLEVPRQEIRAVFSVPDLRGAARPHVERYGDITGQLTDQVRRDLQRRWSSPSPAAR